MQEAQRVAKGNDSDWRSTAREPYVSEAGWYFKTLAVQEIGECLRTYHHDFVKSVGFLVKIMI